MNTYTHKYLTKMKICGLGLHDYNGAINTSPTVFPTVDHFFTHYSNKTLERAMLQGALLFTTQTRIHKQLNYACVRTTITLKVQHNISHLQEIMIIEANIPLQPHVELKHHSNIWQWILCILMHILTVQRCKIAIHFLGKLTEVTVYNFG